MKLLRFLLFLIFPWQSAFALAISKPVLILTNLDGGSFQYLDSLTIEFTGTIQAQFKNVAQGYILYTQDGTNPTASTGEYYSSGSLISIDYNQILRAIHTTGPNLNSAILDINFIKAKAPTPVAHYGSSPNFYPATVCTLSVSSPPPGNIIRYTTNGTTPTITSSQYLSPISITSSKTLKAMSFASGYDSSDLITVNFTYLTPAEAPVASPSGKNFASSSITIKLKSNTAGAVVRYTTNPTALLDTSSIVSGDSISINGGKINDTIVLRAQAFKTGYPNSGIVTEHYIYLPALHLPIPSHAPGIYYDTLTLNFTSQNQNDTLYYSHGSIIPSRNSTLAKGSIFIDGKDDTINVLAVKSPQPASTIFTGVYNFKLSAPSVDKPSQQFIDSINIYLSSPCPGALIYYTLNGDIPNKNSTLYTSKAPQPPISISKDSTVLYAVAIKDNVTSNVSIFRYSKAATIAKLAEPSITPAGRIFTGLQTVTMESSEPNTEIRYTKNGTSPSAASTLYAGPFSLDSTTILSAKAFPTTGNSEPSSTRQEIFTSLPSIAIATPSADRAYADSVKISLSTVNNKGVIFYSFKSDLEPIRLMKRAFPGQSITLSQSSVLQAITLYINGTDTLKSSPLLQSYEIYASPPTETFTGGSSRPVAGGFKITNESPNSVIVKTVGTNGLGIQGIKEAGTVLQIESPVAGQSINIVFTKPTSEMNAIYSVNNGKVTFVSLDTVFTILSPGNYFAGIDTVAPKLVFISQTSTSNDSTLVTLELTDNITNPKCEIYSNGISTGKTNAEIKNNNLINISLKNPSGWDQSLWIQTRATDFTHAISLPADSSQKFFLAQSYRNISTPSVFNLGNTNAPWDLVGFPVDKKSPLPWSQLKQDNGQLNFKAMVLSDSIDYVTLAEDALLSSGTAVWLASNKLVNDFSLVNFQTGQSSIDGSFPLTLHHGWNLVSSPSLEKIAWPFSRKDSEYSKFNVKGLYKFNSSTVSYVFTDTLEPWKGFFTYYFGKVDTTLNLFSNAKPKTLLKNSSLGNLQSSRTLSESKALELTVKLGKSIPVILGAEEFASDEVGREDEFKLPEFNSENSLWIQHGSHLLTTDRIRSSQGAIYQWNLIAKYSDNERLEIGNTQLPTGYQVWAVSKTTGLKHRLSEGEILPRFTTGTESLQVFAAPQAKLASIRELADAPLTVQKFNWSLSKRSQGKMTLNLSVPWTCGVDVKIVSLSGRILAQLHPGVLNSGVYSFTLLTNQAPSIGVVSIILDKSSGKEQITQKVIW